MMKYCIIPVTHRATYHSDPVLIAATGDIPVQNYKKHYAIRRSSFKMGDEITEIFIEKVRKYVYLYDTSHHHYKNVVKKAETWAMIGQELNITSKYKYLLFYTSKQWCFNSLLKYITVLPNLNIKIIYYRAAK